MPFSDLGVRYVCLTLRLATLRHCVLRGFFDTLKYERSLPIEINNRARWVKGGGRRFFSQIEPTVTGLCRTLPCQYHGWGMLGRAGGFQYMREYNAESPKQDSKRFNSQGTTTNVACAQLCSYYYVARSILKKNFFSVFKISQRPCLSKSKFSQILKS